MKEFINLIPEDVALEMRQKFFDADWDNISQKRHTQFLRQFNEKNTCLPTNDEIYTSQYCSSTYLSTSDFVTNIYENHIKNVVENYANKKLKPIKFQCISLLENGHFRLHVDEYIAEYGFVWYLSKNWKWDWGGLLLSVNPEGVGSVTLPTFNKLVVMEHSNTNIHSVTHVASYAKEPRMMMIGFLKSA